MRVEVIDLNETHAAIEVYVRIVSGNYTNETRGTEWIPVKKEVILPARIASALIGPKTEKIHVKGLGDRECHIYTYQLNENATVTGYIDKDI
jgi:hypothetical protein